MFACLAEHSEHAQNKLLTIQDDVTVDIDIDTDTDIDRYIDIDDIDITFSSSIHPLVGAQAVFIS